MVQSATVTESGTAGTEVKKKEIFGWMMFDFANSSYTTVVTTAIYAPFFVDRIVPAEMSASKNSYWALAISLSTIIAIILSPLIGAICDYSGHKKRYLTISAVICSIGTAMLFFVSPGNIVLGIALIAITNAAFMLSEMLCGSFLPDLAKPEEMAKISGLGWGFGYFGGIASLAVVMLVLGKATPEGDFAQFISRNQMAMVATGIFFLVAALPTVILVKNRRAPAPGFENASLLKLLKVGVVELAHSARTAMQYKKLFYFFITFMVFMAGMDVVIKFVGIYASSGLKFVASDMALLFLLIQLSAAAGSLGFGFVEGRVGSKVMLLVTLCWWMLAIVSIYFIDALAGMAGTDAKTVFYVIALIAGSAMGATQSSSRTIVGLLAPRDKTSEMFGFWGMFSRIASIIGASAFALVSDAFGLRQGMLVVLLFFFLGAIMLSPLKISQHGER